MKILAASDIEANLSAAKKLAQKADKHNVDAVILAGDLSSFGDLPKGLIKPFMKQGRKFMFVMGNHDSPEIGEFIGKRYSVANLQGYSVMIGDVGFFGCGGVNFSMNYVSEDDIGRYLEKGWQKVGSAKKTVMVTHMQPEGSEPEKATGFAGSAAIRKAIEKFQPDLHLHGHLHETEGFETKFGKTVSINVGIKGEILEL